MNDRFGNVHFSTINSIPSILPQGSSRSLGRPQLNHRDKIASRKAIPRYEIRCASTNYRTGRESVIRSLGRYYVDIYGTSADVRRDKAANARGLALRTVRSPSVLQASKKAIATKGDGPNGDTTRPLVALRANFTNNSSFQLITKDQ
ncbi:Hypothetical protein NTJ_02276 [Nesidiocoris tenuis]|nr:Hypothetical protein NTJ_02276 [Nesidiocoris tenuis]